MRYYYGLQIFKIVSLKAKPTTYSTQWSVLHVRPQTVRFVLCALIFIPGPFDASTNICTAICSDYPFQSMPLHQCTPIHCTIWSHISYSCFQGNVRLFGSDLISFVRISDLISIILQINNIFIDIIFEILTIAHRWKSLIPLRV